MYTFADLGASVNVSAVASSIIPNGGTFGDYVNAVAASDAKVERGSSTAETLARVLAKGWIPIYCSNAPTRSGFAIATGQRSTGKGGAALMTVVAANLRNAGWEGKSWRSGNYYGWTVNANIAPADVASAAKQFCTTEAISTALKWLYGAKETWGDVSGGEPSTYEAILARSKARAAQLVALTKCMPTASVSPLLRPPLVLKPPAQSDLPGAQPDGTLPGTDIVPASDVVTEEKPFYRKWWFYASLATVGVLGTVALIIWRRRSAKNAANRP